eukprot:NODE_8820_length_500_cov_2.390244_g7751_i0.p5 GENE.NODE_8820_length_500_cov_2.390244_g7751_i0~~NODE_8820_length_500_cov_2.390244_g7751_i0.p5  ORF type:complete len:68 (+),score=8.02 NODE_8820_length_500_cov_2.390244_g7751_i0:28-204(+)
MAWFKRTPGQISLARTPSDFMIKKMAAHTSAKLLETFVNSRFLTISSTATSATRACGR